MGIFKKKDEQEAKNLPTDIFLNPSIKVLEGFKGDRDMLEPIIRLTKFMREKYGLNKGDTVVLKKGGSLVKAKVDISSAADGNEEVCRLNKLTEMRRYADSIKQRGTFLRLMWVKTLTLFPLKHSCSSLIPPEVWATISLAS